MNYECFTNKWKQSLPIMKGKNKLKILKNSGRMILFLKENNQRKTNIKKQATWVNKKNSRKKKKIMSTKNPTKNGILTDKKNSLRRKYKETHLQQ